MSSKDKILLLTYAFPPNKAAESYLCVKALAKIKYKVDVVTLDPFKLGLPTDDSLSEYINNYFGNINRIKNSNLFKSKVFSILRFFHLFPDRFQIFNNNIFKKVNEIDINEYKAIISWSQWHSIHLAALKLKINYPNIKWILHMSDPWKDNPFLKNLPFYYNIQSRLERKTFKYADIINFTSQETIDLVFKKYPLKIKLKTSIIPHSFEKNLFNKSLIKNKKITIRYLGNFYGPRNPKNFCYSLKKILDRNKNLVNIFKFEFYGNWIGNQNWKPSYIGLSKSVIEFISPKTYLKSLELMSSSDFLLIIDAPFEKSVFFPSKLVDYIGSKKPIIAITPPGTSEKILKNNNAIIINPLMKDLDIYLENALIKIKDGEINYKQDFYDDNFSSNSVGKAFENIIDKKKISYIPKIFHLVPADGYGGVEVAAKYTNNIKSTMCKFEVKYIYDQKISSQNYSALFNPFKIIKSSFDIIKQSPDVIILSLWRSILVGLLIKIFKKNISLILFIHSETNSHWLDYFLTSFGLRLCDEVWADSYSSMNKRLKKYKISKNKKIISFLPRILSRVINKDTEIKPNFIYWGRIGEEKQINISITIFAKILKYYPDAKFRIIGPDGGSKSKLKALINYYKISKSVIWFDELDIQSIIDLARKSFFYIQASKFEGMAVSVAEAMQLGLLPIVTNVGEIKQYCKDNENSLIITDIDDTVNKILNILSSKTAYYQMSINASKVWENKDSYRDSIKHNIEDFTQKSLVNENKI